MASTTDTTGIKSGPLGGPSSDGITVSSAMGRTPDGKYHAFDIGNPGSSVLYGRIPNKNKVVNICLYRYESNEFLAGDIPTIIDNLRNDNTQWDNWKKGVNAIFGGKPLLLPEVPESVMPVTDDLKIEGGYKYELMPAVEAMKQGGGTILGKIKDLASNLGSTAMSVNAGASAVGQLAKSKGGAGGVELAQTAMEYGATKSGRDAMVTSKLDQFGIYNPEGIQYNDPKGLKLSFNFGGGGYFNGEIEVVRPIIALAAAIAPQFQEMKDSASKNRMRLPGANPAQFYAATWGGTLGGGVEALSSILAGGSDLVGQIGTTISDTISASGASGRASAVANGLMNTTATLVNIADEVVKATINGMEFAISAAAGITTVLFYRIGQYIAGPFQIESISYNFDYSMVDEAGYPYKGDINLGLRYIYKPEARDLIAQAGYIGGGE